MLRAISDYAKSDRAAFIREIQEAQASQQDSDIKKKKRRLTAAQKRAGELERLVCKIYEDNALGRLPDARYAALDAQYAKEQGELSAEIAELEKAISSYDQGKKSAEKFIALIDKYQGFDAMTNTMFFVLSPEELLIKEMDEAEAELMPGRLAEALTQLSPIQVRRLHVRYALKKKYREIAAAEGVSHSCACESVYEAIRKLQKYFAQNGWLDKEV